MQLQPWIDAFGSTNLRIVHFDDFVQDRTQTVNELCDFLGIDPESEFVNPDRVHNTGENQLLPPDFLHGLIRKITRSQWYKRNIHPYVSQDVRDRFKRLFYKSAKERPDHPSLEVIDYIIGCVQEDVERLSQLMGRDDLLWDLEAIRQKVMNEERELHG